MFTFFLKRKKNEKTSPDVSDFELGEEALEKSLTEQNFEPKQCVASASPLFLSSQQRTHITLVQGSSDSKPEQRCASKDRNLNRTDSITGDSHVNVTFNSRITSMIHLHRAPPVPETPTRATTSKLYPTLDPMRHSNHLQNTKAKFIQSKKLKLIHDMAEEICCSIDPTILYANISKKKLDQLKDDARKHTWTICNIIGNSSKLEYTFNKEVDVIDNDLYVNVHDVLHTFDDVRLCHKRATQPFSNNTKAVPIFQTYSMKLRCYKGHRGDVIDCD